MNACKTCGKPATMNIATERGESYTCDSVRCIATAGVGFGIGDLDASEEEAILVGGDKAGAYLEELGHFDLSALTGEQWAEFLRTFLVGFREALHAPVVAPEAPF